MQIDRVVIVFDAADVAEESAFWAGVLGGRVVADDDGEWHSVVDGERRWRMGVQHAPDHVPPAWPSSSPGQQVHLDLHVPDIRAAHGHVLSLGATLLQAAPDLDAEQGVQIYASPAGHPLCLGWGQRPAGWLVPDDI